MLHVAWGNLECNKCVCTGSGAPGTKLFRKLAIENRVPVVSRKSTYRNVSSASQNCSHKVQALQRNAC